MRSSIEEEVELPLVRRQVDHFLAEDAGKCDITTELVVPSDVRATGCVVAREPAVIAGLGAARMCFEVPGEASWRSDTEDGAEVDAGDTVGWVEGRARSILTVERTALNLLSRLSGVATMTRRFVDAVEGTGVRVLDTRKTTPGLRSLEKHAVKVGGGSNHRERLDDGILIKDNHIALAGGVSEAVSRARWGRPDGMSVVVEVTSLDELNEALDAEADAILLDNMSVEDVAQAVHDAAGQVPLEVSGGVGLGNVRSYAATGVDSISVGRLTHSAPGVDLSLELQPA